MEKLLTDLTTHYKGWILVSFTTPPSVGPRAEQSVIVTLQSLGGPGEQSSKRKIVTIANVLAADVKEG